MILGQTCVAVLAVLDWLWLVSDGRPGHDALSAPDATRNVGPLGASTHHGMIISLGCY